MNLSRAAFAVGYSLRSWSSRRAQSMSMSSSALEEKYPHLMPQSNVVTGYNNEDVASELLLLNQLDKTAKSSNLRCLIVTGGGDNFLSVMAHPSVQHVTALDMDPCAQALAQTKLALAKSTLTKAEVLTFLGTYDEPIETMDRLAVFESEVKPHIDSEAASILESKLSAELQQGFNRFGSLDNYNRHINHLLVQHGFSMQDLLEGTCANLEQLHKILVDRQTPLLSVHEFLETAGWAEILPPPVLELVTNVMASGGLQTCLEGHHKVAGLAQSHIARMTFLHQYTDDCHPDWLREDVRERLVAQGASIEFHTGNFLELPEEEEKYDMISPSNIFDWMPHEKSVVMIPEACQKHLHPSHGLFLLRRCFGGVPDMLKEMDELELCPDVTPQALAEADKAPFFYKNVDGLACLQFR